MSMTELSLAVMVGVDTHADMHVAAVVDMAGRIRGTESFPTNARGYAKLLAWARGFGDVEQVGVEGTGSYGAGLARFLRESGCDVVEVDRPDRKDRRRRGKSDPIDAEAAARAVLAGTASGVPKTRDGDVEMIRVLRVARSSALKARTQAANQLQGLIHGAPDGLREQLRTLTTSRLVRTCAAFRVGTMLDPVDAYKHTLRSLARRYNQLAAEVAELDARINPLVEVAAPQLLARPGIGYDTAAQLLVTAGDNPQRIATDAAFARLCGAAPLPASSGRVTRHRLNRGGDRRANNALWRIAIVRMSHHQPTRDYVARRTAEGLSKREIIRCLKRYIAREIHHLLTEQPHPCAI